MDVRGRNLVTGLPRTITVSSEETEEALREATLQIVEAVHSVLEKTPPELAADVADRGIVLTGGGSLLRGLEELIEERTGINTMTAEHPMCSNRNRKICRIPRRKKRRGLMHKVRIYAHFLSHVYKDREGIGRYKLKL